MVYRRVTMGATGGYKANRNGYGGGNKKVGIGTNGIGKRGTMERILKTDAYASHAARQVVYCGINMLGGIGVGRSQFQSGLSAARPDGSSGCKTFVFKFAK